MLKLNLSLITRRILNKTKEVFHIRLNSSEGTPLDDVNGEPLFSTEPLK